VNGGQRSIYLARALTSALYVVKPFDALCYFAAVEVIVALITSAVPARRAASVDETVVGSQSGQ
jgi:ABC-type lipoprotein release transport system permease subunit